MSVWAIIDCEQRSFSVLVCMCSHIIPPLHLTRWIPKDQQRERWREEQEERGGEYTVCFHFELQCIHFEEVTDTRHLLSKSFDGNSFSEWASSLVVS